MEGGVTWKFDPVVFVMAKPEAMHEHLAGVRCRVALFSGDKSYVVPPETGEYMYQLLRRNAPLVSIPEAHHHLMLDQPLAFIAALQPGSQIRAFVARPVHRRPEVETFATAVTRNRRLFRRSDQTERSTPQEASNSSRYTRSRSH